MDDRMEGLKKLALLILHQHQDGLPIVQFENEMEDLIAEHGSINAAVSFLQKEISDKRKATAS